ncbi:monocarboxylate transporter 12 [Aplysia californica]|uniref:Monocarboxylate transporter 12 n=1 Tax=Aplysia californica TaxID=6500 RepID=A0ABM0KAP5_APLCA|nr:monocarboxylate transporter 12 [Aplysia californica]
MIDRSSSFCTMYRYVYPGLKIILLKHKFMIPSESAMTARRPRQESTDDEHLPVTYNTHIDDANDDPGGAVEIDRASGPETFPPLLEAEGNDSSHCGGVGQGRGSNPDEGGHVEQKQQLGAGFPKDRGWAWMVVLGGFGMHLLATGAVKSFGVFFLPLQSRFLCSAGELAMTQGVTLTLMFSLGVFANMLCELTSTRVVVLSGSLLCCVGLCASGFAPSLAWFYLTYCVITGVGLSLCYVPSVVYVNYWFDTRRTLANGISVAGGGGGSFLLPNLLRWLMDGLGLSGSLILLGGIVLNVAVCAMLFRPASFYSRPKTNTLTSSRNHPPTAHSEQLSQTINDSLTHRYLARVRSLFDWTLLWDPVFLILAASHTICSFNYPNVFLILPAHAFLNGQSADSSALLLSIVGITDLLGRVVFGYLSDLSFLRTRRRYGYIICMYITGSLTALSSVLTSFPGLAVYAAMFGLFAGSYVALIAVMFKDALGDERLGKAFSLVNLISSVTVLTGPLICGRLRDTTGTWEAALVFCGVSALCGASLLLLFPLAQRLKDRMEDRMEDRMDTQRLNDRMEDRMEDRMDT